MVYQTLLQSTSVAVVILTSYVALLSAMTSVLYHFNVKLKL